MRDGMQELLMQMKNTLRNGEISVLRAGNINTEIVLVEVLLVSWVLSSQPFTTHMYNDYKCDKTLK